MGLRNQPALHSAMSQGKPAAPPDQRCGVSLPVMVTGTLTKRSRYPRQKY